MKSIRQIPIHLIKPSPFNVRQRIDTVSLTRSMGGVGQIESIRVRPEGDGFEIRTGMRRFLALKEAGATQVDALVVEGTDDDVVSEQWAENEEREAYTDYERALKLRQMMDTLGCTQTKLAEKVGKDQPWISRHLAILTLDGIMSHDIIEKITEYQARAILQTPEKDQAALVSYVELYFEERGAILPASAIVDYAGDLTRARELEKNRCRFNYEIEETGYPLEPADAPVAPEVTHITSDESIQHLNEEIDRRDLRPLDDKRPLLKETPTIDGRVVAFINQIVGIPAEDLRGKLMDEHGLSEEEAQAALQAYRETYPDIWDQCYTEESEELLTAEEYVADVLMHNPEVGHEELVRVTVEMFNVTDADAQSLIDRIGKRRGRKPRDPTRPTIPCPLCGRANAEKIRIIMVLEAYQAQPGITVVEWLTEVLA